MHKGTGSEDVMSSQTGRVFLDDPLLIVGKLPLGALGGYAHSLAIDHGTIGNRSSGIGITVVYVDRGSEVGKTQQRIQRRGAKLRRS